MMPQAFNGKMPMGAQSVLAAGSGPNTQIQYLPVPVVTVPPGRPPSAPTTGLPQPPQPPMFVNAFTPGATSPMAPPSAPLAYGPNGYPLPPGFGPYPGAGAPPAAIPQQVPPNVAVGYQGPTPPPNPFGSAPVVLASYTSPAAPSAAVNVAMDRRNVPATMPSQPANPESLMQLTAMLRDSLYPSQRMLAAEGLTDYDWHYYPQVVQALLVAARDDPAPLVRASCVSCFAKMNVKSQPVLNVLNTLRNDADARVRQEAEQALARLH